MSLEQKIEALTVAVEALTAAMKGGAPAAGKAATPAPAAAKTTKAEYKAEHTADQMKAALTKVKETLGTGEAKAIIKDVGKADKMADITDPKLIDACYKAATAKLEEQSGGDDDDGM